MSGGPTSGGQGQLDPRCQEASQRSSRHSPVGSPDRLLPHRILALEWSRLWDLAVDISVL